MDKIKKIYYVYYSYEEFGRGYIGYRKCPENKTPETDKYLGSYKDNTFNPTKKIILFLDLSKEEALEIEIKLHKFYDIDNNPHFANRSKQKSARFSFSTNGKVRINNGIEEILIYPKEEIPEGYILGRLKFSEETRQKMSESHKGEKNFCYGKKCYNNGKKNKYFFPDEEIPEDYVLGQKEETKNKISKSMKGNNNPILGKIKINNGIIEKYISPEEEMPEGFILGVKEETKNKISMTNGQIANKFKNKITKGIKVITQNCCYYSISDAYKELNISEKTFYKFFYKDSQTGFYIKNEY